MKKRRVTQEQAKCDECGCFPDMGVTSGGLVILLCFPCASRLAIENDLPTLAAQIAHAKANKTPSN
jgi:hypothetical protein